ncbi:hypothetical protein DSO57_1002921 [Entomophthora muscae]|uniref:Uncharacterized protein n=1 Tax=Entomophthora muscae TaxID=34485 RepID=A0ACC2T8F6_9FUNG|nr:hypothetical protein DSO57_1002921 [Entomophthora muscae]
MASRIHAELESTKVRLESDMPSTRICRSKSLLTSTHRIVPKHLNPIAIQMPLLTSYHLQMATQLLPQGPNHSAEAQKFAKLPNQEIYAQITYLRSQSVAQPFPL